MRGRQWLTDALSAPMLVIAWLIAQIPLHLTRPLGVAFGLLLHRALKRRRQITERNLELCFPELDAAERARLTRVNFASLGVGVLEFIGAWWGGRHALPKIVALDGIEHLTHARAQGRGVLLVSGHFHTLELCGRLLTQYVPLAGMYRPHDQRLLEWMVARGRRRYAIAMYTRSELKSAIKHLKSGGVLWYAPDQDYRRGDHVFAPFFGVEAASLKATHQLARLGNAAVVGFSHRRAEGGYALEIFPPLTDFPSDDAVADTTRVNALIEDMVRAAPSEYLWLHQRFKTRPTGEPSLYD
jgi:Kdo2-lipid IVA lauroyltransferase/acyltransferase